MTDSRSNTLDDAAIFETVYMLAADKGRDKALFGSCQVLARKAFATSLLPGAGEFPEVWFEIPLMGQPRFDLHVAHSREAMTRAVAQGGGWGDARDAIAQWYASGPRRGAGVAFAYDVSSGSIEAPALHVNVNGAPASEMEGFFDACRRPDAEALYRDFTARLPQGWHVWYAGLHPGRPGAPVRVDCFVDHNLSQAYARDPGQFDQVLRGIGFEACGDCAAIGQLVARSPFNLELQFDVLAGGTVGSTIGVSAGFHLMAPTKAHEVFGEGGPADALLRKVQQLGLADDRWKLIADTTFATLLQLEGGVTVLYNTPTFLKLRVREGATLDAKVYLQAGVRKL